MGKRRGTVFIALGLLLLMGAAGLTLYNMNQETEAGEESDVVMTELTGILDEATASRPPAELLPPEEEPEPVELDGRSYLGVITFPTLGLQLPVQTEWSYPNLRISPCRMSGSPTTDDLVILAHNYCTHFGNLKNLEAGDEVSVTLIDGATYVYSVDAKEIVPPTAVEDVTSGEWPLTLFTCTLGGRTRVVVHCDWAEEASK